MVSSEVKEEIERRERITEKFYNDDRKLYDIDYREYLRDFGIDGDSHDSIKKCWKSIIWTKFYPKRERPYEDCESAIKRIKMIVKFFFIFPLLAFTDTGNLCDVETKESLVDRTKTRATKLILKDNIEYEMEYILNSDHDELKQVFDELYQNLLSSLEHSSHDAYSYKCARILISESDIRTIGYTYDFKTFHRKGGRFGPLGLATVEYTHLEPITTIMELLFDREIILDSYTRLKTNIETVGQLRSMSLKQDFTLLQKFQDDQEHPLIPFEVVPYNASRVFESLGKLGLSRHFANICFCNMLAAKSEVGYLLDGNSFAEIGFNFGKYQDMKLDKYNPDSIAPMTVRVFDNKSGNFTATMMLCAKVYSTLKKMETGEFNESQEVMDKCKSTFYKSGKEISETLQNAARVYHMDKNYFFEEVTYWGQYEELQVGFECNCQVLALTLKQLEELFSQNLQEEFNIKSKDHRLVLKIYDPVRKIFTEEPWDLRKYNVAKGIEDYKENELNAYQRIREFNISQARGSPKINAPTIYKTGNIKLTIKDNEDFFSGGYIVMDLLEGIVTTTEHLKKGRKQAELFQKAGVDKFSLRFSSVRVHNGEVYFIGYGFSELTSRDSEYNTSLLSNWEMYIESKLSGTLK